ncbi:hypothetical protein FRC12_007630 [Ceratobasidium sp. 428]|nr:hypothetical protein FRC12_007630 [Ceratobasidium sp. 428]
MMRVESPTAFAVTYESDTLLPTRLLVSGSAENIEGFNTAEEVNKLVTPQEILEYLVEWFAEDDISFNMLTHWGFQRFFSYIAQGNASVKDIPERHTVAEHVSKQCERPYKTQFLRDWYLNFSPVILMPPWNGRLIAKDRDPTHARTKQTGRAGNPRREIPTRPIDQAAAALTAIESSRQKMQMSNNTVVGKGGKRGKP